MVNLVFVWFETKTETISLSWPFWQTRAFLWRLSDKSVLWMMVFVFYWAQMSWRYMRDSKRGGALTKTGKGGIKKQKRRITVSSVDNEKYILWREKKLERFIWKYFMGGMSTRKKCVGIYMRNRWTIDRYGIWGVESERERTIVYERERDKESMCNN